MKSNLKEGIKKGGINRSFISNKRPGPPSPIPFNGNVIRKVGAETIAILRKKLEK